MMSSNKQLDVGDEVVSFFLESTLGSISMPDIIDGKWGVVVTCAEAFDPVATTDLGILAKMHEEFSSRNIQLLIICGDTVPNLRKWIKDVEELQTVKFTYPLLSDPEMNVLKTFGCAKDNFFEKKVKPTSLGCFIIDIEKRIRFSHRSSLLVGRNWYEVLRQYDALFMVTIHRVVCPSNWGNGQEVMIQKDVSVEEAANYRYVEIKPWFRLTPCPDL